MNALVRQMSSATVGLLLLTLALTARGTVTGSSVANLDGSYTYSYVVDNTAGAFDISYWSIEFDFLAPDWNQADTFSGGDVSLPNVDWFALTGIPLSGASSQDFLSLAPTGDVQVGTSLAGFSFTSWFAPGTVLFAEFDASGSASSQGSTVGPSADGGSRVPEGPGANALVMVAVLAGCDLVRRRANATRAAR